MRAQCFDIFTLLADHDTWTGAVNGDTGILRRTLDGDLADVRVLQLLQKEGANLVVFVQLVREVLAVGVPLRGPGAGHRKAESGRIDFLTHTNL